MDATGSQIQMKTNVVTLSGHRTGVIHRFERGECPMCLAGVDPHGVTPAREVIYMCAGEGDTVHREVTWRIDEIEACRRRA